MWYVCMNILRWKKRFLSDLKSNRSCLLISLRFWKYESIISFDPSSIVGSQLFRPTKKCIVNGVGHDTTISISELYNYKHLAIFWIISISLEANKFRQERFEFERKKIHSIEKFSMIFINFFFSKQKKRWIASRKSLFEFKIRNSKRDFVTKLSEIANGYPKPNDSNRTFIVIENCFETFSLLLPSLIWSDFHFLQCFLFIGALIRNYFVLVIGKKKKISND